MKQELLKGITDTLSITPYQNNRPAVSSAATIKIYKSGGTVVVNTTSATVNGTTGEITYDFNSSVNTEIGQNFKAEWTYTISSVVYYQTTLFDVVLNKLAISVVDDDLLVEQSDILERNESFGDLVTSSSSTTLVCNNLKTYPDDHWNGGKVIATNPTTGDQQFRNVNDFVKSTGTITVDTAWTSNPTNAYTFIVRKGFQKKIEQAFNEMMLDVSSRGYRPSLILESSELKVPLIKKSLSMICKDYMNAPDDKWSVLAKDYEDQYNELFGKVKFQYDRDESGVINSDEDNQDLGSIRMKR